MIYKPISNNNSVKIQRYLHIWLPGLWVEIIYFLPFSTKLPGFIGSEMEPRQTLDFWGFQLYALWFNLYLGSACPGALELKLQS